jgi:hypothetical protein
MIHNHFFVMLRQLTPRLEAFPFKRNALMQQIEDLDLPVRVKSLISLIPLRSISDTLIKGVSISRGAFARYAWPP